MKITIKDIAVVQTGVFAKTVAKGEIVYLQAKHFDDSGQINQSLYPDLEADRITKRHMLVQNDILFAAKGARNFAASYAGKLPAVASTSFFVIRPTDQSEGRVLPEFVVWYLNHPNTLKFLKNGAVGSSVASISKSVLEDLEMDIPDLETQKMILEIVRLRQKEKNLNQQIEKLKGNYIQQQLINALNNSEK